MSKIVMLRPATAHRRQPLLHGSHRGSQKAETGLGEAVGGLAAVCCCCPFGLANIMFLAMYKLPASLYRRALQKKKKKKQRRRQKLADKDGLYMARSRCSCGCGDEFEAKVHPSGGDEKVVKKVMGEELEEEEDKEVIELEKEMWERFYSAGFWRSCSQSQRDNSSSSLSSSSERITTIVSVPNLQFLDASIL